MEDMLEKPRKEMIERVYAGLKKTEDEYGLKTGTTIVSEAHGNMGVIASDTKVSAGYSVSDLSYKKIRQIGKNFVIGGAGAVSPIQSVMDFLELENNIYRLENGHDMTTDTAASVTADMLKRAGGAYGSFIFMGNAKKDGENYITVFSVGGDGSIIGGGESQYMITGSGGQLAEGVIQDLYAEIDNGYKPDMDALVTKAVRGIEASKKRDLGSGGKTHAYTITTKNGIKELTQEEIEEFKTKRLL